MDLDLRSVRSFVTVADELHFGRAAAILYISQPSLSRQISRLENRLGYPLLVRDSRHVVLTEQGERFLSDARRLLVIADQMVGDPDADTLRVAHIAELTTSRELVDGFAAAHPDVTIVERSLDSTHQLEALLTRRIDVAVLRVTSTMLAEHPSGWMHRIIRYEPMRLVGRRSDPPRTTASLHERAVEVFGDSPATGYNNAHTDYLRALQSELGVPLRWRGNPSSFSHCLAAMARADDPAYLLEFDSYARRYADAGFPVYDVAEVSPVYPWSIAWRDGPVDARLAEFVALATRTAHDRGWTALDRLPHPAWLPRGDPSGQRLDAAQQP